MTKRVAALLALVAFAVAWLIGVARGAEPLTRLENAGLALASAFVAGLGIGLALEKIVLARFSSSVRERPESDADRDGDATFEARVIAPDAAAKPAPTSRPAAIAKPAATARPAVPVAKREAAPAEATR